jgi:small subunit ribosomal protein S18
MAKRKKIDPTQISYKNVDLLENAVSRQGTILPREKTGLSNKHQRKLAQAVKRARHLALVKYTQTI